MTVTRLLRGLLACSGLVVLVLGCVIEERKYNPDLPALDASMSISTLASVDLCRDYCQTTMANCTGRYSVYLSDDRDGDGVADDCMAICQHLPAGTPGDKSNTVECRRENAIAAANEQTEKACEGAGPGGNTVCGDTCDTYCSLRLSLCGAKELGQDVDLDRCKRTCPALDPGDIYNADPMTRQDTLQCRLNHLVFASRGGDATTTHCPHTAVIPQRGAGLSPPCADQAGTDGDCPKYCKLVTRYSCIDENRVYESEDQCLAVCKAFPLGKAEETGSNPGENTVACRRYHAYAALGLDGPVFHCPHAGPMGDGHCGAPATDDNCFSYCRILKRACTARFFQTYLPGQTPPTTPLADNAPTDAEDLGTCMASCSTVPGNAPDSRYSVERAPEMDASDDDAPDGDKGDALQCRVYHAIRALAGSNGLSPTPSECAAAFGDGACQ